MTQLFAVVYKRPVETRTKSGKVGRQKWARGYRTPRVSDENLADINRASPKSCQSGRPWNVVPNEEYPLNTNTIDQGNTGCLFGAIVLAAATFVHGTASELFRTMVEEDRSAGRSPTCRRAAYVYLSFSLDKFRDYNSRMTRWHANREVMVNTFDRHDFAFKWSYAEMAMAIEGLGYEWVIGQTAESIEKICGLVHEGHRSPGTLFASAEARGMEHR